MSDRKQTQTEKYGIKFLRVGQVVTDDDYGEGTIEKNESIPRESWHPDEFEPGKVFVRFQGGEVRSVPSSTLQVEED
jgi:hypothetical protein